MRGQKLGPFLGRGGVALKPKPSCARSKPCGSKSREAQLCEARNWVRSLGGGRGIEAQAKLCEVQALREQVVRGPVVRAQELGPFLGRGGGMAGAVGVAQAVCVACKNKEMSKWPEILWGGWIDDGAIIAKLFFVRHLV